MKPIRLVGTVFAAVAAYFWWQVSVIDVPDNIYTFVDVLKKAGELNARAAGASVITAICTAYIPETRGGVVNGRQPRRGDK